MNKIKYLIEVKAEMYKKPYVVHVHGNNDNEAIEKLYNSIERRKDITLKIIKKKVL